MILTNAYRFTKDEIQRQLLVDVWKGADPDDLLVESEPR